MNLQVSRLRKWKSTYIRTGLESINRLMRFDRLPSVLKWWNPWSENINPHVLDIFFLVVQDLPVLFKRLRFKDLIRHPGQWKIFWGTGRVSITTSSKHSWWIEWSRPWLLHKRCQFFVDQTQVFDRRLQAQSYRREGYTNGKKRETQTGASWCWIPVLFNPSAVERAFAANLVVLSR